MRAHVHEPIPVLRTKVRGWLPVELEQLVVQCLAKHPNERPEDARALQKALASIEIPEEHAWTDTHAQMWWGSMRVSETSKADAETAPDEQLLVPQREPTRAPGSDARTIEARPNARTL